MKSGSIIKLLGVCIAAVVALLPLRAQNLQEFPNFPVSLLQKADFDKLAENDTPEGWRKFADESKKKADEFLKKQFLENTASWLYTYYAADLFAKHGASMPFELKAEILRDLPTFFDFYETISPKDKLNGACNALAEIYKAYPAQFKKYKRAAYALSLIYDEAPPPEWPECNVPSNPVKMGGPLEIFLFFAERSDKLIYPIDKLTVGELIWLEGVGGPMDELRSLSQPAITPFYIERLALVGKLDNSRKTTYGYAPWPVEVPYTPANIKKHGGAPIDRVYYAWRVANANGIPCIYFSYRESADSRDVGTAWLAYMSRVGLWKFDVAREKQAMAFFDRPLSPQTWEPITLFDISMLERRANVVKNGMYSNLYVRLSEHLFDAGNFTASTFFANQAKKANPENWKAHYQYIKVRARAGAPNSELDANWKKAYETFRKYPEKCLEVLGMYKSILMRRGSHEGLKLYMSEMRHVMRTDSALAMHLFAKEIEKDFGELRDKTEILPMYTEIVRMTAAYPDLTYKLIVKPLMDLFAENLDETHMKKTFAIFTSITRSNPLSYKRIATIKAEMAERAAEVRKTRAQDEAWAEMDKEAEEAAAADDENYSENL